ncbi:hypothetical protein PDE_02506 [Penicillium oxalicum 114-2]|uniref:Uncharacterized protein n=2 Tax=Penicillium oxalicum TaxID=69781 RepID=S8ANS9_PENO1|nr:hypothetical protein PDE_02506 [Penicillium oxalicum 114-2]
MGNLQSSPSKDEPQRANRLSKPFSKPLSRKSTVSTSSSKSSYHESDGPELNSAFIGWQNPWVGSGLSSDARSVRSKAREIPPTLFETEVRPPPGNRDVNHGVASPAVEQHLEPHTPVVSPVPTIHSVRRASYQPGTYGSSPQRVMTTEPPRRANSMQTSLTRQNSVIYEDGYEGAAASNTYFMVDNQRFSLTRRRSLLTRPGIATRRSTRSGRRAPSPIGEPPTSINESLNDPVDDLVDFGTLQWPLASRPGSAHGESLLTRPTSPPDSRYTQLGALKLGSLRVVNGSASPCPSDRTPLESPGLGLSHIDTSTSRLKSTLEITAVPNLKKSDDLPDSPFSFEKSPTIPFPVASRSLFPSEVEDEGIALYDDTTSQSDKKTVDSGIDRSTSRSLNKSDSGYSSAASVGSHHHSRTRASFDSQASGSFSTADNHVRALRGANEGIQQRLVSQHDATPGMSNFSQLHPKVDRWYDSIGPAAQLSLAAPRSRRSTLCAPRYTEYQTQKIEHPSAGTPVVPGAIAPLEQLSLSPRGSLHTDCRSPDGIDVPTVTNSAIALGIDLPLGVLPLGGDGEGQTPVHRSASERCLEIRAKHETMAHRSRSRSGQGHRNWSQTPGIEAPPLPTAKSWDFLKDESERARDHSIDEAARGRPRSRSQDLRRRKLTKPPRHELHP